MSKATKVKLKRWVKDDFVLDLLEGVGILYPHQLKEVTDDDLIKAGLKLEEIEAIRKEPKLNPEK